MRGILNIRMLNVRAALLAVLTAGLVLPNAQAQSAKQNHGSDKQASGSSSTSSHAQVPSADSKAAEEESGPANKEHTGGPHEGIKVHGHWVIDVRNPDGKLVSHREFENALSQPAVLLNALARQNSVGFWGITLQSPGHLHTYFLAEPTFNGGGDSNNLTVSTNLGLVLSGSIVASMADTIEYVETENFLCSPSNPPLTPCQSNTSYSLTAATLSSGVSFVSGQTVTVIVTITFS